MCGQMEGISPACTWLWPLEDTHAHAHTHVRGIYLFPRTVSITHLHTSHQLTDVSLASKWQHTAPCEQALEGVSGGASEGALV